MSQFAPPRSFVDIPFFAELSKFKLEHAKLSDARQPLEGFITPQIAAQRAPAFRLDTESFSQINNQMQDSSVTAETASVETAASPSDFTVPGHLLNLNTIEEFKELDKLQLLRTEAKKLGEQITDMSVLLDPSLLCKFLFLSFSDLKKYKFYYWLMFPALAWTSTVKVSTRPLAEGLSDQMSQIRDPLCVLRETESGSGKYETLPLLELSANTARPSDETVVLGVVDFGSVGDLLPWHLRNVAALLAHLKFKHASIYIYRPSGSSRWIELEVGELSSAQWDGEGAHGWERNSQNKLVPKVSDVSSLLNPHELATQAVGLNLKLMKWRAAPQIDLERVAGLRCLLLGAGTLGSYIARGLMAWGVHDITFVDSGTVSYSNPVRQPLYSHADCVDHAPKAETAARALQTVFPGVTSRGLRLEVPMLGHPITSEDRQREEYDQLVERMERADVVFLLMDSRESRWLPTVIAQGLGKTVINVALGLDSYVVMRHGVGHQLGCYFCNDVVAPSDSLSRQTLDQMCTVTRPGCAMIASGHAVELLAALAQVPELGRAPNAAPTVLGEVPHQLRGFLSTQEIVKIWGPAFPNCSGCGPPVVDAWKEQGWTFVKAALSDPTYITELSGLGNLQRQTEDLELESDSEAEMM